MLSNLLENGEKYIEKCNFYIKYFDKIKCYANRPYIVFSELKPETHIYFFSGLMKNGAIWERVVFIIVKLIRACFHN